jgi:hypothetical protein
MLRDLFDKFKNGLQGSNLKRLQTAFGPRESTRCLDIIRRFLFVAKRLTNPYWIGKRLRNSKSKAFRMLTEFRWNQHDWNVGGFLQVLEQFNLSQLFLQIVTNIMQTSSFSEYVQSSRKFFRECVRQDLNKTGDTYVTLCVIDSLVAAANSD